MGSGPAATTGAGRHHTTLVRGVRMASYQVGTGGRGDVVVVPGLCVASYLRPVCDAMAERGFLVQLVEPPGWPRSGRPTTEPTSVAELAGWVTDWLELRDLTDVVLVGQSMGAQVGAHVAARVPGRIKALILQGPVFDPAYRTRSRALRRWLLDIPREPPTLAVREVPEWLRVGPRRLWGTLRLSVRDRLESTVLDVDASVTVVVGEHETLSGRSWAASLGSPGQPMVTLPGAPHSAAHTDPAAFADMVASRY